ncbi:hypothetical protein E5288_WYG005153 [Bos mutus]|uniref:Uncharacterized protein n=1 Tax=Bos mutus TaxID=72004 RepID=A0A6B0S825_9CETA|nr:hypothetical protein [Bos mutus]
MDSQPWESEMRFSSSVNLGKEDGFGDLNKEERMFPATSTGPLCGHSVDDSPAVRKLGPESNSPGSWAECREVVLRRGFQVTHGWPFFNSPLSPMPSQGSGVVYPRILPLWSFAGLGILRKPQVTESKGLHCLSSLELGAVRPWSSVWRDFSAVSKSIHNDEDVSLRHSPTLLDGKFHISRGAIGLEEKQSPPSLVGPYGAMGPQDGPERNINRNFFWDLPPGDLAAESYSASISRERTSVQVSGVFPLPSAPCVLTPAIAASMTRFLFSRLRCFRCEVFLVIVLVL